MKNTDKKNEKCEPQDCKCRNAFAAKVAELEANMTEMATLIDKTEDEKAIITEQLKKVLADYTNLERDMGKRMAIAMSQLKAKTALEVINVMDDVNYALQSKESIEMTEQVKAWVNGLVATLANLQKSLDVLGVKPMGCQSGDVFDSDRQMAISIVKEGQPNTIAQVVQDGYVLAGEDGVIVRPARVIVSK